MINALVLAFMLYMLSEFSPTLAKSYNIETPEQYFDILQQKLMRLHVAVEVDDHTICNSNTKLAAYEFVSKTLILCRIAFPTGEGSDDILKLQTITHELVHLAQDCKDGLTNASASDLFSRANHLFMVDRLSSDQLAVLEYSYPSSQWALELEAFYLEDRPLQVLQLLDQVCFSRS